MANNSITKWRCYIVMRERWIIDSCETRSRFRLYINRNSIPYYIPLMIHGSQLLIYFTFINICASIAQGDAIDGTKKKKTFPFCGCTKAQKEYACKTTMAKWKSIFPTGTTANERICLMIVPLNQCHNLIFTILCTYFCSKNLHENYFECFNL